MCGVLGNYHVLLDGGVVCGFPVLCFTGHGLWVAGAQKNDIYPGLHLTLHLIFYAPRVVESAPYFCDYFL